MDFAARARRVSRRKKRDKTGFWIYLATDEEDISKLGGNPMLCLRQAVPKARLSEFGYELFPMVDTIVNPKSHCQSPQPVLVL